LVEKHFRYTGSLRARMILDQWAAMRTRFVKVFPHEYKRALKQLHEAQKKAEPQKLAA
jgi:glutamate synthase (NADPH/NADH) large chain